MMSEFCGWLRSGTNRHGRPFQEDTVLAYRDAAVALDAWMTRTGLEADFTGCDTAVLNRFFAEYLAAHCQTGANTNSATCGICSAGRRRPTGTRTRTRTGCTGVSGAAARPSLGQCHRRRVGRSHPARVCDRSPALTRARLQARSPIRPSAWVPSQYSWPAPSTGPRQAPGRRQ
jgi:hypothetical protein